jgi:hypothetical protein
LKPRIAHTIKGNANNCLQIHIMGKFNKFDFRYSSVQYQLKTYIYHSKCVTNYVVNGPNSIVFHGLLGLVIYNVVICLHSYLWKQIFMKTIINHILIEMEFNMLKKFTTNHIQDGGLVCCYWNLYNELTYHLK